MAMALLNLLSLLFLLFFSIPLFSSASSNSINVLSLLYQDLPNAAFCVRLLHKGGLIGCSSRRQGDRGRLRLANNWDELENIVENSGAAEPFSLVMPYTLASKAAFEYLIASAPSCSGVLIFLRPGVPSGNFEVSAPQFLPSPDFFSLPPSAGDDGNGGYFNFAGISNSTFPWNSAGDGLMRLAIPFSVVLLTNSSEGSLVLSAAQLNEQKILAGEFPSGAAEFQAFMFAKENSRKCLAEATCIPVGGYSIWGTIGKINKTEDKPFVFAVASRDSNSLFHSAAPGADADQSGVIALMAAARALASPAVARLPKQIAFALFTGESWNFVGSRKFVWDLHNFRCLDYPDSGGGCARPFKPDLTFQKVNFSRIEAIVELNQVGKNSSLFLHTAAGQRENNNTMELKEKIRSAANSLPGQPLMVEDSATDTPGLPPASANAFLAANPQIPTVLISDHYREFSNRLYHSEFDNAQNLLLDNQLKPAQLCQVATLTARTLFIAAGGSEVEAEALSADCDYINTLFNCLIVDLTCPYVAQYTTIKIQPGQIPSHYSSVFMHRLPKYIGGLALFYQADLAAQLKNSSATGEPLAFWHDAFDPALQFNYEETYGGWTAEFQRSDTFLWTESNWDDSIGVKIFQLEDPKIENLVLGVGIAYAAVTMAAVWLTKRKLHKRFQNI